MSLLLNPATALRIICLPSWREMRIMHPYAVLSPSTHAVFCCLPTDPSWSLGPCSLQTHHHQQQNHLCNESSESFVVLAWGKNN